MTFIARQSDDTAPGADGHSNENTASGVSDKFRGREKSALGTVLILISAAAFGLMAIFTKYAYAAGINLLSALTLRFTMAATVMWLILAVRRESPVVTRRQLLALAGLGAMGYGLMSTFYFSAVRLIPASLTAILLYTYPVIVTVISGLLFKEKITLYKVISLIMSSVGLFLVVGASYQGLHPAGLFYGLMAAVVYALYVLFANRVLGDVKPVVLVTYVLTAAAAVFNIAGWTTGSVHLVITFQGWLAMLGISLVSTVVAILTFFEGMSIVGPSRASIISTVEPVVTVVAAFFLFAESLTLLQTGGGALVMAAVLLIHRDK